MPSLVKQTQGKLAERSKAAVLKTVEGASLPGVRIPNFPPNKKLGSSQFFCLVTMLV